MEDIFQISSTISSISRHLSNSIIETTGDDILDDYLESLTNHKSNLDRDTYEGHRFLSSLPKIQAAKKSTMFGTSLSLSSLIVSNWMKLVCSFCIMEKSLI